MSYLFNQFKPTNKQNKMNPDELKAETVYYTSQNAEGTFLVYMKYLGYSIEGRWCFEIWNDQEPERMFVSQSDAWIKRNLRSTI